MLMQGFPPPADARVTLANWQLPPYNRWSFSHMRELVPTQRISRGQGPATPLPAAPQRLGQLTLLRVNGTQATIDEVLDGTYTDAAVVVHGGRAVFERYAGETAAGTPHLLMSISKSVVSCVVGNLVDRGLLSPGQLITDHVPELEPSGYRGASLRNVLDMRSGVDFSEDYTDLNAEVRIIEEAIGWRPPSARKVPPSMYAYLTTLGRAGTHGGVFDYRSCETDVLGWVCERAAGTRMADLISELVWSPVGAEDDAEITCDGVGTAIHDGGMCATARDLARFGMMLLAGGEVAGRRVVPAAWLRESWTVDPDVRGAFAQSVSEPYLPAAGTGTSSGSCRGRTATSCCAWASTARCSTSPRAPERWPPSCPRGRTRSRRRCWRTPSAPSTRPARRWPASTPTTRSGTGRPEWRPAFPAAGSTEDCRSKGRLPRLSAGGAQFRLFSVARAR